MVRSIEQLKNAARREEQRENWSRAIDLYSEAVRKSEEGGGLAADLSLYNRIGDLHRRRGDTEEAVRHYLMAVDGYAEQGLHTGAVALCNKILRIDPDQVEVYRKLGGLHAETGLMAEARRSLEEYVSRVDEAGGGEELLDARLELAQLADDEELRRVCVEELIERGRRSEAVAELTALWKDRVEAGEPAEELRDRILELDPTAELAAAAAGPEVEEEPREPAAPDADVAEVPAAGPGPDGREADRELPASGGEDTPSEPREEPDRVDLGERIRSRLGRSGEARDDATGAAGDYDFDGMLVGFRARVAETVGEANPEAHVELGVALRQMGLVDDAIREFQLALRASDPPLRAFELLGECFIERGLPSVAVRVLRRGARLPGHGDHELLGILYQLGIALQGMGEEEQALDCFERVYSVDIDFRDVGERMEAVSA